MLNYVLVAISCIYVLYDVYELYMTGELVDAYALIAGVMIV